MFGLLVNPLVNALDIAESFVNGDGPSKRQVAQLVDDGVGIAAIAAGIALGADAIESLLD